MKKSKRLLAALCAFAVAFSAFAVAVPFFSAADESAGATVYKDGDVIFESGYDDAKTDGTPATFHKFYSDMLPVNDSGNVVIKSNKSWSDHNYLFLGADYKSDSAAVAAQSITVKEGDTYTIEFKYKLEGTSTNDNFQMGICTTVPATFNTSYNGNRSNTQVIATKETAATEGWVTYKETFTVYAIEKAGETPMDKLAIYTTMVHGRTVWFDDVKVTMGGSAKSVIFESGYDDAKIITDNWAGNFTAFNSDMLTMKDPDDASNTAVRLKKVGADYSYLYPGADYKNGRNEVAAQSITVAAGDVYTVEFKYKIKTAGTNAGFKLGICTTVPATQTISKAEDTWGNNKYIENEELVLSGIPAVTDDWVSVKTVYTVYSISKTPETAGNPNVPLNKLAIFASMYHGCELYIDDVKITRGSGEETDKVIYENDFSSAVIKSDVWGGFANSCGNVFPIADPDNTSNTVLTNVSGVWGHGALLIGAKMQTNDANKATAIKAEKGAKYRVEFDYKLSGSNYVAYEVGIGVGPNSGQGVDQGPAYSLKQPILSYPAGTSYDGTWKNAATEFEIPEDADFSNGEYLQLYFQNGHGGTYYFDNVKITKLAKKQGGDLLADNDYQKAFTSTTRPSNSFTTAGSDVLPVKESGSNIALEIKKLTSDYAYIYLGANYVSKSEVTNNSITAEDKSAYSIEFDYKMIETDANGRNSNFKMGFCLVGANTVSGTDTWGNNTRYSNADVLFDNSTASATDGWAHYSGNYIVPSGTDLSETDKLAIFMTMYHGWTIYIDNVKVKKIDFVYTVKFDTNGGSAVDPITGMPGEAFTLPDAPVKTGCEFMGWYEDTDFTVPAENLTFEEEIKTLYARFKKTQYIQSFEDTWAKKPIVMSDWFEHLFVYNTSRQAGSVWESWSKWTGTSSTTKEFDPDGVRTGSGSVYGNVDGSSRIFTLFLDEPLIVGEEYTLSYWVKMEDYTIAGMFEIWFNNGEQNSGKMRTAIDWPANKSRSIRTISTSTMKEYFGEWIEVKVDFTANGKWVGIGVPPYTQCYIDDACVTLKSADESLSRTIDGEGLKFEEWYDESAGDKLVYVPKDDTEEIIKIAYAPLEGLFASENSDNSIGSGTSGYDSYDNIISDTSNGNKTESGKKKKVVVKKKKNTAVSSEDEYEYYFPTWGIVLIAVGAVLAAGAVVTVIVVKKRRKQRE